MLPSEELRQILSDTYQIDLNKYAWSEEFKQLVFSTPLDKKLEENANTLEDIYHMGFNIGNCGLTSRYIARRFDEAELYYGTATLLIGTKNSEDGDHSWTVINNFVIDSTLMLCIPINEAEQLGYAPEKQIEHSCARLLSEFNVYDNEYKLEQSMTYKKTNK